MCPTFGQGNLFPNVEAGQQSGLAPGYCEHLLGSCLAVEEAGFPVDSCREWVGAYYRRSKGPEALVHLENNWL